MAADRPASYRSVFAVPEFRPLFGSYLLSTIGDELARLALTVLVYQRTGSALLSAATFAISYLPWLLGGPVLSALADRFPRRTVLVASDAARAVLVGIMALPGMPLPGLLVLLLAVSVCSPPFESARSALTADILTDDRYAVATSVTGILQQVSQIGGFLLGGFLATAFTPSLALAVNALTFAVSAIWLAAGLQRRPAPVPEDGTDPGTVLTDVGRGLRLVLGTPRLASIVAVLWVGVLFVNGPEGIVTPLSVELTGSAALVGVLLSAQPAGTIVGAVLVGRFTSPARREQLMVPLVVLSLVPLVLVWPALHLGGTGALVAVTALLALSGAGSAWTIPLNVVFVQAVPSAYRGRAFGVAIAGLFGAQGLGAVGAGALASELPPTAVVGVLGAVGLVAVVPTLVALVRTRPPTDAGTAGPSRA